MLGLPKANRTILDEGPAAELPSLGRSTGVRWLQFPLSSFHVNANGHGFPSLRFDNSQGGPQNQKVTTAVRFCSEGLVFHFNSQLRVRNV